MKNSKFLRSKNLMYGCKKGLRKETAEQQRRRIATQPTVVRNDDTSVVMPECSCRASRNLGFTLVELVIVIAIVIVLSVVSVPIYRSYVDKAKMAEGYALIGTILSAQKAYYSEYGNFYEGREHAEYTSYMPFIGIDVRGNKYFTSFVFGKGWGISSQVKGYLKKPEELHDNGMRYLNFLYNITSGMSVFEERG